MRAQLGRRPSTGAGAVSCALALCGALAALLIASTTARAALVTGGGGEFSYVASPGEANDVRISDQQFADGTSRLRVGHGNSTPLLYEDTVCAEDRVLGGVNCPIAGPITIAANLGDLDDQLTISGTFGLIPTAVVDGGPGNDALVSAVTRVDFTGGDGDDRLASDGLARSNPPGAPVAGDVFRGGPGRDSTCFNQGGFRDARMTITLDGVANDGVPGENDNIMPDVEEVCGSQQDDTIVGTAGPDVLHGEGGNDMIEGGAGDDDLHGSCGDDTIVGGAGADSLHDDPSSVAICLGGNDTLEARDGERDTIFCGGGADTVVRDEIDVIGVLLTLCERDVVRLPGIKGKRLPVANGRLRLKIACPPGGAQCRGKLTVKTAGKARLGGRRRKHTLATGRYRVPAGRTKATRAKLTAAGRRAATSGRRLKVKVQLRTAAGTKITRNAKLSR